MRKLLRRASSHLHTHPTLRLFLLLAIPTTWLVVIYIGSLSGLLQSGLFSVDVFTGKVNRTYTFDTIKEVFSNPLYYKITLRTVFIAAVVTAIDIAIAYPISFFITFVLNNKYQKFAVAVIVMPLWASYIVKQFAWRQILDPSAGIMKKYIGYSPGFGMTAMIITLAYLWLPFVIIPIQSGMRKIPSNLLDASSDLGAKTPRTTFKIITPLVIPSIVAGSIFSFALTLGDYFAATLVGGGKVQVIGLNIYKSYLGSQKPSAAVFALFPIAIMVAYLLGAKFTGALNEL